MGIRCFSFLAVALGAGLLIACDSSGSPAENNPDDDTTEDSDSGSSDDSGDTDTFTIPQKHYNIIMIVVDTLRMRGTSLVAGARDTTPNLAAWAEQQVVFENTIPASGSTPPSIASLLSGLYPSAHGLINYDANERVDDDILLESIPMFSELLKEAGYQTTGLLKASPLPVDHGWGQGFDSWGNVPREIGAENNHSGKLLTDATLDWLANAGEDPFFLYVHYNDPHAPYQAPEPWYDMFVPDTNTSSHDGSKDAIRELFSGAPYTDDDIEKLTALYDGETAYWDSEFVRIPQFLEASGLLEDTIVVVLADHGEQFAEHGGWMHAALWQEIAHVPLVMSVPGALPGRVSQRVSLVDVVPTLSALTGIPGWDAWQGADLSAVFGGNTSTEARHLLSEFHGKWALIAPDGWKAYYENSGEYYLHDLVVDPLETADLSGQYPDKLAELLRIREEMVEAGSVIRAELEE